MPRAHHDPALVALGAALPVLAGYVNGLLERALVVSAVVLIALRISTVGEVEPEAVKKID